MFRGNKKVYLSIMLICVLLLSACGSKTSNKADDKKDSSLESADKEVTETNIKDEIIYGIWSSPSGVFNPMVADTLYDNTVNSVLYNGLLEFDKDLNLVPALAKGYEVSEDNLKITFELKDNIKWHDGEIVKAEDVKFTFENLANPDYEGNNASFVENIVGADKYVAKESQEIEGIKVVDNKVELNFIKPYAPALTQLGTLAIIPKHIWGEIPVEEWIKSSKELEQGIGTGPYKIEEYKDGEFVKLAKNPDYFQGEVKTPYLIFKVANEDTAQAELINGTIDIAGISSNKQKDIDYLEENGIKTISYPNSNIQYMGINLRNEVLQDKNIRQAMAYGLDRELIVNELIDGNGKVIHAPMVPSLWSYPEDGVLNPYKRDVEKARELIKKAGYEYKDENSIAEKNGKKLSLTLTYPSGDKAREMVAPIIQNQLKEIGIDIELEIMDFQSLMEKVVGNHEFDLYLMANTLGAEPDPKPTWYSTQASDEKGVYGWNISGFRNEKVDKLLDEGLETLNQEERKEIYTEFAKIMNDELPWIPLYVPNLVQAYNSNLKNYEPGIFRNFYNIHNWIIEK